MKITKIVSLFIFIASGISLPAQDIVLDWAFKSSAVIPGFGKSITVDNNGNTYVTGKFWNTVDFDPSLDTANMTATGSSTDIFLAKYDSQGNYIWSNQMGSTDTDAGFSVQIDGNGDVYVTGFFGGTVNFNPQGTDNLSSNGGKDIFLAKYDQNGNYLWAINIGGTLSDEGKNIAIDGLGNVCITGYFNGTANFNPSGAANLSAGAESAAFLAKYDANGNYIWAFRFGGTYYDWGACIDIDYNDNIYITGEYTTTTDFDPSGNIANLTQIANGDAYVAKYDKDGNYLWVRSMGAIMEDTGRDLVVDDSGSVYVTGQYELTADFNLGGAPATLTSAGLYDAFLAKYDENGNYVWARNMGGSNLDYGYNVALDSSNNVYVTGDFRVTADFNLSGMAANVTSNGGSDVFLAKYDTDGNFIWVESIGGSLNDGGKGLVIDNNDNIIIAGNFGSTVDFDPSTNQFNLTGTSGSSDNFFIAKYFPSCALSENIYSFTYYGKSYEVIKEKKSWNGATTCAIERGGYLVEINDSPEQDSVYDAIINGAAVSTTYTSVNDGGNIAYVWVGASDNQTESTWLWDGNNDNTGINFWNGEGSLGANNGTIVGANYNNWGGTTTYGTPTNPDNNNGSQHAAAIGLADWPASNPGLDGSASEWNDLNNADSIYYIVEYDRIITATINTSSCDSYTSPSGKVWTTSNTYMDTVNITIGSDSIFTIELEIFLSTSAAEEINVCYGNAYTFPDGTTQSNITTTNSHVSNLASIVSGCDSIITTTINVLSIYSTSENIELCNGEDYMFPDGSTQTNIVIPTSHVSYISSVISGCDSVVTTTINANPINNNIENVNLCIGSSYTYPDGLTVTGLTQSETYTSTLSSVISGCDSLITTNINIPNIDATVTNDGTVLTSNEIGASYQWINCTDTSIISGETNQSLSPTETGTYMVETTIGGCSETSTCEQITITGINDSFTTKLTIWPNPSNGIINISGYTEELNNVELYNSLGEQIDYSTTINGSVTTMYFEGAKGIYFLAIENKMIKIIKD